MGLDAHPLDYESRALWHLELLGCFEPGDAVAPWEPPEPGEESPGFDYDDEGGYLGELVTCWSCGGEGNDILCCDDLCHGQGWCMHGDNYTCRVCGGEGAL